MENWCSDCYAGVYFFQMALFSPACYDLTQELVKPGSFQDHKRFFIFLPTTLDGRTPHREFSFSFHSYETDTFQSFTNGK